jgi:hypothetical protein
MAEVKSFKMVNGDEVVAEVVNSSTLLMEQTVSAPTTYRLRRPHVLQFQQIGPGQVGLAFVPWALSNPSIDSIEIPASSVVCVFSPAEQVERQYLEQTSGISLARPGVLS